MQKWAKFVILKGGPHNSQGIQYCDKDHVKDLLAHSFLKLEWAPCQQQTNGSDCGAFATGLVFGFNPQNLNFDIAKVHPL